MTTVSAPNHVSNNSGKDIEASMIAADGDEFACVTAGEARTGPAVR